MFTIAGISGSLRKGSTNTGLLRCAASWCEKAPLREEVQFRLLNIQDIPLFNADVETAGVPESVQRLVASIREADALLLACPEYNYSMAPALKNALDWASRAADNAALSGKPVAMMGAGGLMGTSRAQYHLRQVCVRLNMFPLNRPEGFFNAFTDSFNENGDVDNDEVAQQVEKIVRAVLLTRKR